MKPYTRIIKLHDKLHIRIPNIEYFVNRLKNKEPFAFARLTHQFWEINVIQGREIYRDDKNSKEYISEILSNISIAKPDSSFFLAITLVDYTPEEEILLGKMPNEHIQAVLDNLPDSPIDIYDGLLKDMAIQGQLSILPEICRNTRTIVVATELFSKLKERWNLSDFIHVKIPLAVARKNRHNILQQIKNELSKSSENPPIVLFRAGPLSFWLMSRLYPHYPNVFYLDMGQTLNIWLMDQDIDWHYWTKIVSTKVIETCKLKQYYMDILGEKYDIWYKKLIEEPYNVLQTRRVKLIRDQLNLIEGKKHGNRNP